MMVRILVVASAIMGLTVETGAAQEPSPAVSRSESVISAIPSGIVGSYLSLSTAASAEGRPWPVMSGFADEPAGRAISTQNPPAHPVGVHWITLEQVKQQSANRMISPLARLGQLQIEAAKQHRLGVQADYFPKFGASFANLHYTDFLGRVATFRRPFAGSLLEVPVPLFNQNMTIAALTFTQPITPVFTIYQAVKIARADERIAMAKAKAGISVAKNTRESEVQETYFKLLIAQRRVTSAEWKVKTIENRPQYAAVSIELARGEGPEVELVEAKKALETLATEVRALSASLNQTMGWPDDTELELATPEPLVENISLDDIADKSAASNPDVVEAEQTVIKARGAFAISKLAYVPTVAAVSGFTFQNAIPLVPSSFGYGGVIASYNLFDFGKREHAVQEARAQLGMAEMSLELTKAKVAANLRKSYLELEQSRQLSNVAQKMGSSAALLMKASSGPESLEVQAARAELEVEMLQADLAHRQAYAHLTALVGSQR
jgi:outer membrane protein TolC